MKKLKESDIILLAEDSDIQAKIIEQKIREITNCTILRVRNAIEAIEILKTHDEIRKKVKLIATDILMGGVEESGPALLKANIEHGWNKPMIVFSGSISKEQATCFGTVSPIPVHKKDMFFSNEDHLYTIQTKIEAAMSIDYKFNDTASRKALLNQIDKIAKKSENIPVLHVAIEQLIDPIRGVINNHPELLDKFPELIPETIIGNSHEENYKIIHSMKNDLSEISDQVLALDDQKYKEASQMLKKVACSMNVLLEAMENETMSIKELIEVAFKFISADKKEKLFDFIYNISEEAKISSKDAQIIVVAIQTLIDNTITATREFPREKIKVIISKNGIEFHNKTTPRNIMHIEEALREGTLPKTNRPLGNGFGLRMIETTCNQSNTLKFELRTNSQDSVTSKLIFNPISQGDEEKDLPLDPELEGIKDKSILVIDHIGGAECRMTETILDEEYRPHCKNIRGARSSDIISELKTAIPRASLLQGNPNIIMVHSPDVYLMEKLYKYFVIDQDVVLVFYGGSRSKEYIDRNKLFFETMGAENIERRLFAIEGTPSNPKILAKALMEGLASGAKM